jgi:hypothetical protein
MQCAKLFAYVNNIQDDIKCILQDKQFHLQAAQIRAEGNNTKCVGKKIFNGSVTQGLRKEHMLHSPPYFGQGQIIYANHDLP